MRRNIFHALLCSLFISCFLFSSCASTGPRISKAEKKKIEEAFNLKFLEASQRYLPKVYGVGYRLLKSHVPDHGAEKPKFDFAGIGVDDLKDYARKAYGIDKEVKGVLVRGTYPGSKAGTLDFYPGDVIEKMGTRKTKSIGSFFRAIRKADSDSVTAQVWRHGKRLEIMVPLEKVYYNAQFFLEPTPDLDANSAFSRINIGVGAIRYCKNDDELAVIMGHELAHTTLKHSLKKMGTGIGTTLAYGAAAAAINQVTFGGVGDLLMDPAKKATESAVSRRYEREADYFGLLHAFHSEFNIENGSRVFSRLATDTPSYNLLAYTFSSHPKSSERFLRLGKIVEELKYKYPQRANGATATDWEIVVPVEPGETIQEAVDKMVTEQRARGYQPTQAPAPPSSSTAPTAPSLQPSN